MINILLMWLGFLWLCFGSFIPEKRRAKDMQELKKILSETEKELKKLNKIIHKGE